jgi:hypothetical protein
MYYLVIKVYLKTSPFTDRSKAYLISLCGGLKGYDLVLKSLSCCGTKSNELNINTIRNLF